MSQILAAITKRITAARDQTWWASLNPKEKKAYLAEHPNSKYAGGGGKAPATKAPAAKPAATKPAGKAAKSIGKTGVTEAIGNKTKIAKIANSIYDSLSEEEQDKLTLARQKLELADKAHNHKNIAIWRAKLHGIVVKALDLSETDVKDITSKHSGILHHLAKEASFVGNDRRFKNK